MLKMKRIFLAPKDLKVEDKKYRKNLKNKAYTPNYSTEQTKNQLLKISKNRCCFCGRIMNSIQDDLLCSSIEHILPQSDYPESICKWKNLIFCCCRCNIRRKNKYDRKKYISPYSKKFKEQNIFFTLLGSENTKIESYNYMIDIYGLNDKELMDSRKDFILDFLNPAFMFQLEMEKRNNGKTDINQGMIIFYDVYKYYKRRLKK